MTALLSRCRRAPVLPGHDRQHPCTSGEYIIVGLHLRCRWRLRRRWANGAAQRVSTGLLRWLRPRPSGETAGMRTRRPHPTPVPPSAFAGFRFPADVIVLAVRWYLRFGLSYRDVEELRTERGVEVDHVTIYRWVLRFTPLLAEAARPCRHTVGDRWQVDETYVKVAGQWRYVYRAIDQFGQIIDVFVSASVTEGLPAASSSGPSARPSCSRSRSSPIGRRPTRSRLRSSCRQRGIAPTSTPTTGSNVTAAG